MDLGLLVIESGGHNRISSDSHDLALVTKTGASMAATNPLFGSWIHDGAGGRHIWNDFMKSQPSNVRHNEKGFFTGETVTASKITRSSYIEVETFARQKRVPISGVSFIAGFHCNILSCKLLCHKEVYLNERKMELQDSAGRCRINVREIEGMLLVEHNEIDYAFATPTSKRPSASPVSSHGTTELWRRRFAHISKEAVSHIPQALEGAIITDSEKRNQKGDPRTVCETCALTKSHH